MQHIFSDCVGRERQSFMNMVIFVVGIKFLATLCSCFVATHKLLVQILDHCGLLLMCFVYNPLLRLLGVEAAGVMIPDDVYSILTS